MITTTAIQRAKAGKTQDLESLMKSLIQQVSANEPGCTLYQYVRDPKDPSSFLVIEQYEDQTAFDFHKGTKYLADFIPKMEQCLDGPPKLAQYADVFPNLRVNRGEPMTGAASFFHIGVVVEDLAKAVARFSEVLELKFTDPATFHIPCLEDPNPHAFDLVASYSMTSAPYYELIQADGDGIVSAKNKNTLLYFAVWEPDMAGRIEKLKKQGIGIDAYFRKDPTSPPFAMITAPDLLGVRMEYVDISAENAIDQWVWTGKYPGGTP